MLKNIFKYANDQRSRSSYSSSPSLKTRQDTDPGGGVLHYKGLMGTCGQPGNVFRDFCLKPGIDFIIFCLNQGIDFISFCLYKQGIFSWTINSLRVCPTNVLEFCL